MKLQAFFSVLAATLLANSSSAEILTGRVVDANGVGVPNVNIAVLNNGSGGDPDVFNGGTDASGFFTTTVTPAGIFDVLFEPPAPPVTTHLTKVFKDFAVVGTVNFGNVVLASGVALSGRCLDGGGLPVAAVDIDVIDLASGIELSVVADTTNGFGNFNIAVPPGAIEVRFDTTGLLGPSLAPRALQFSPTTGTNIGDVLLPPGNRVSGRISRTTGGGVANASVEVTLSATGELIFTPTGKTNSLGDFSVVVPEGVYDLRACPPVGVLLVPTGLTGLVVGSNTNLGTLTMDPGVVLSGIVHDDMGVPLAGVDIDVDDPITGNEILICHGGTGAGGAYSVVVPLGAINVEFGPDYSLPLGSRRESLFMSGNTLLDVNLPSCPFAVPYGPGLAGTGGVVPVLTASGGAPRTKNLGYRYRIESGLPGAQVIVVNSLNPLFAPLLGGTLLADFRKGFGVSRFSVLDANGSLELGHPVPPSFLAGLRIYSQAFVKDPGAVQGWAFTQGTGIQICP